MLIFLKVLTRAYIDYKEIKILSLYFWIVHIFWIIYKIYIKVNCMYLFDISKLPIKENIGDNNVIYKYYNIILLVKRG